MTPVGTDAEVKIEINPQEIELAGGNLMKVEDVMTNLMFYNGTLEIRYRDSDSESGEMKKAELKLNEPGEPYGYTIESLETGQQKVTFWLPDATYMVITYSALIDGEIGKEVAIKNTVTIHGTSEYSDSASQDYIVKRTEGGGSASQGTLTVVKHDAVNSEVLLKGAKFKLYTSLYSLRDTSSEDTITTVGGKLYYFFMDIDMTDTGMQTVENGAFLPGLARSWALVEVQAPLGYQIDSTPIVFRFGASTGAAGETADDTAVSIADMIFIPNASGAKLPETGGPGVKWFYMVGIVPTAYAALELLRRYSRGGVQEES